jgi:NAD(P)-dependent dehydrogenase (short-subunit alcohol dehydrogenase family)
MRHEVGAWFLWRADWRSFRPRKRVAGPVSLDVLVEQVDLSEIPAVIDLHKRFSERGTEIGVLINNAGHGLQGPFLDEPLDKAMTMLDLDVVSMTAVTRLFAEYMRLGTVRSSWSRASWPSKASRTSPFTRPRRRTCYGSGRRFIANSSATALE